MLDRREALDRLVADALRGAVGRDQLGMLGFELLEPLDEPVVLAVGDFRGRLDVVLPVVVADFLAEPGDFRGGRSEDMADSADALSAISRQAAFLRMQLIVTSSIRRSRRRRRKSRGRRAADAESGTETSACPGRCCGTGAAGSGGTKTATPGRKGCSRSPSSTTPVPSSTNTSCSWAWACFGVWPPGATSNCRIEKLGAASSGPIRQRMRQPDGPFGIDGSGFDLFTMDDFHGNSPFSAWTRRLNESFDPGCLFYHNDRAKKTPRQRLPAPSRPPPRKPNCR